MKTIFLLLVITVPLFGQNVDYKKIILPESSQSGDFGERLVQIAWRNHPNNEIAKRQVNIAGYQIKQSHGSWLDIINISANVNEFVINPAADQFGRAVFYPKYNIRGSISLSMFITIPYQIKKDRENLVIAQANVNAQKLALRNTVLKLYNQFLLQEKIYKLQTQALLDNETSHKLVEQRFKNGESTFETYSASLNLYNQQTISQMQAENNYKNAKLDLEQWIGMRLEDVR